MSKKKLFIIALGVVLIGIVILWITRSGTPSITNYKGCVNKGYPILESYPSVCKIPGGSSFTNPDEVAPKQPK